jgi:hypothetical protein
VSNVAAHAADIRSVRTEPGAARKFYHLCGQHHRVPRRTSPLYRHIPHSASPSNQHKPGSSAGRGALLARDNLANRRMTPSHFHAGAEGPQGPEGKYYLLVNAAGLKELEAYSTLGSSKLPTAPWWSPACNTPLESRKKERIPVRPYSAGIAASSYLAGAPEALPPTMT